MSVDLDTVELLPDQVAMKQPADMTLFLITHYDLVYTNTSDKGEGIRMNVHMKRKVMTEMMTTYFPSILLMLITFATTFFKPFFFEAALSVNLTTMLVMTTIFISKMEGLPPTSDTKMIDYWLILCQLVPFAVVVLHTAKEYIREEEKESTKETMNRISLEVDGVEENKTSSNSPAVEVRTDPGKREGKVATMDHLRLIGEKVFFHPIKPSSEKKVIPATVLLLSTAYFAVAGYFYYQ